jgi:hypothetical protein
MKYRFLTVPALILGALALMGEAPVQQAEGTTKKIGTAFMVPRLYSGADGESHLDMVALPDVGSIPGKFVQSRLYSTDVELGESLPGMFIPWHGVSSPRFLIVLSGQLEIGLGDGSKHILKAGDMVLAEDMTGRGHTSRAIGTEIIRSLTVRLPKDNALAPKMNPCPPGLPDAQCVAARQLAAAKAEKAADAAKPK